MAAKSALDISVRLFDAVIEGDHLLRECGDQLSGDFFAGKANCLDLAAATAAAAIVGALRTPASVKVFASRVIPLCR